MSVRTPDTRHAETSEDRSLVNALWGGTAAMRAAGELYLPKEPAEDATAYKSRLSRSYLFNAFKKTIKDMSGKVFAKPVVFSKDAHAKIKPLGENIDHAGTGITNFAADVFECGLRDGVCYILTDMDPVKPGATLRSDQINNRTPYFLKVEEKDLIGIKSETIKGVHRLTQIRILEHAVMPGDDEFSKGTAEKVRVFDRLDNGVQWRIFHKTKAETPDAKEEWVEESRGMVPPLTEIPLVAFYANKTGFFTATPLLKDLADLNVAHWQSASDQRNILHVARVPILFGSGFGETDKLVISAGTFTKASDANAKLGYVEHSGAAIGAGSDDLKSLEEKMQALGLELVTKKPGGITATGEAIDAAKMNAPLGIIADNMKDALEQSLAFAGQFLNLGTDKAGSVTVNKDFTSTAGVGDLPALATAAGSGIISHRTWRDEAKKRGTLSEDVTDEEEEARLELQGEKLGTIPANENPDLNNKPDPQV